MKIGDFGVSWFDLVVLVLIGVGIYRGRSRGMSEELLDLCKWLIIVVVGGMFYRPVGEALSVYTHLDTPTAYVFVYLGILVLVRLLFSWVKRGVGEKLVGADVFGAGEYYLGMVAGAVRFVCYLIVGMALINSHYVSPEELAAQARMQHDNFGDISFPTIGSLQQTIFNGSASGQVVKKYLGQQLIVTTASDRSTTPAETLGRQRERAVAEVLGEKR